MEGADESTELSILFIVTCFCIGKNKGLLENIFVLN